MVSVVYDGKENASKVRRVKGELALPWPTIVADDLYDEMSARYGFNGFPQYMLLNRDGTLFAGTNDIQRVSVDLPALLDEMLAAEN